MRSAAAALASRCTTIPHGVDPSTTVSIVARISAPTDSAVTPRCSSIARWPSAVAPPWLPIAGTTNGSAPSERSPLIDPRSSSTRRDSPRLPAPTATVMPGRTASASVRVTASCAAASASSTGSGPGTSIATSCSAGTSSAGSNGRVTPARSWSNGIAAERYCAVSSAAAVAGGARATSDR